VTKMLSAEELEAHIPEILTALREGRDEIIVTKNNIAVARISPAETPADATALRPRTPGRDKGKFTIPESFYEPMTDEELKEWGML
jgi:antitoxin (DNA-binding transcriptional repressor) of toxin-antitoxin stability system